MSSHLGLQSKPSAQFSTQRDLLRHEGVTACRPVPVHVLEGAAVRAIRELCPLEFAEELHGRKFLQLGGGLGDQLFEAAQDLVRQRAEGRVGNVPGQNITHTHAAISFSL